MRGRWMARLDVDYSKFAPVVFQPRKTVMDPSRVAIRARLVSALFDYGGGCVARMEARRNGVRANGSVFITAFVERSLVRHIF
jgi:hypothetical protein